MQIFAACCSLTGSYEALKPLLCDLLPGGVAQSLKQKEKFGPVSLPFQHLHYP